jgi:hypothetical protein
MRDHYLKVGSKIYDVGAAWRGWVRRGVGYDKRDATKSGGKMGATVSGMLSVLKGSIGEASHRAASRRIEGLLLSDWRPRSIDFEIVSRHAD